MIYISGFKVNYSGSVKKMAKKEEKKENLEPEDFYTNEQGFIVFKASYHLKRGYCCKCSCKHCPFGFKKTDLQ